MQITMPSMTDPTRAAEPPPTTLPAVGGRGPLWPLQRYYGVFARPQTYLNLLYLVLGLPLGIAYFVSLVTFISVSGALVITLVGIPLLVATMYYWCLVAGIERAHANVLLGTRIRPMRFGSGEGGFWKRNSITARLGSGLTWRSLLWLFLRFPQGIATFVLAVVLVSIPIEMTTLPITAPLGGGPDFYYWQIDTLAKGLIFVVPGLLLLPASLYVCNFAARLSGSLTRLFLDSPAAGGQPAAVDRAMAAAVTWRGLSLSRIASPEAAHEQTVQLRAFVVHAAFFSALSLGLLLLNGVTTPGTWWAIWPIWGLAIVLGAHAGYLARGFFGLHAGLFVVINVGLFVIDATYTGATWFFYPLLGWGLLVILHGYAGRWLTQTAGERARRNWAAGQPAPIENPPVAQATAATADPEAAQTVTTTGEPVVPATEPEARNPRITIDVVMRIVTVAGREIDLTPKEFDLLSLFAQNPGRPFSRDELLDRIWRNDYEVTDRTIDTHVQRLRKKLGEQSEAIQTVWGVGYKFQTG